MQFINFLVKNYTGYIEWRIGKYYVSSPKPYLDLYILMWGILKLVQSFITADGLIHTVWWDYVLMFFLIPQFLAGFTQFAINEQKKFKKKDYEEEEKYSNSGS